MDIEILKGLVYSNQSVLIKQVEHLGYSPGKLFVDNRLGFFLVQETEIVLTFQEEDVISVTRSGTITIKRGVNV